jgi:hypothetical protein
MALSLWSLTATNGLKNCPSTIRTRRMTLLKDAFAALLNVLAQMASATS